MNMDQYKINLDVHGKDSRQSSNFHQTTSILSLYIRGTYCMGMKFFNTFPFHIKDLSHDDGVSTEEKHFASCITCMCHLRNIRHGQ
jgi:hypothetical protein